MTELDTRLYKAGCVSTRVRVLADRYPDKMKPIVERIEKLSQMCEGNNSSEEAFDTICIEWYLSEVSNDNDAFIQLKRDLSKLEKEIKHK